MRTGKKGEEKRFMKCLIRKKSIQSKRQEVPGGNGHIPENTEGQEKQEKNGSTKFTALFQEITKERQSQGRTKWKEERDDANDKIPGP